MTTVTMPGVRVVRKGARGRGWLWLVILAVVAVGGYLVYQRYEPKTATTTPTTVRVTKGDIASTVAATGNLEPATQVDLNLTSGGVVKAVLVKAGDTVQAGQPLLQLQTTDLELAVTTAQANLDSAKLKLEQAKQGATDTDMAAAQAKVDSAKAALNALYAGPTQADLTDAQARLVSAQAQLTKARQGSATSGDIAAAQANITSAQANLDKVKAGATEQTIANAQQKVEQAKNALWAAQSNRDSTCGRAKNPDEDSSCQGARAQVNQQEANVQMAQNDLAALQAGPTATDITQAQASVTQAQANLQKLTTVNPNDVTVAQQNVNQAQAALDKLREGPTDANVAQAQANVTQAQAALDALAKGPDSLTVQLAEASVKQADAQLQQAQYKLEQATLTAPFAGVVTAVNTTAGATVGTNGAPVQLADLNNLQIKTQVSELDRARLKVGQPAKITLEALSGKTLQGEITSISPTGTSTNGVVNYTVIVKVTQPDPNAAAGMTATLNIVVESKQGVLRVANRAIQTVNGQKVVHVLRDGQTVTVQVQTGITDSSMTEISSPDLKEGDLVVVNGTSTTTTTTTQGGPGMNVIGVMGGAGGPPPGR